MTDGEYLDLLQQAHEMEGLWPFNLAMLAERKALERSAQICVEEANEHKPGPEDYSHHACLDCEERIRSLIQDAAPTESKED